MSLSERGKENIRSMIEMKGKILGENSIYRIFIIRNLSLY